MSNSTAAATPPAPLAPPAVGAAAAATPADKRQVLAGLWAAAWGHRRRTITAIGLLLLAKLATVTVPLVLKAIVDRFSRPENLASDTSLPTSLADPVVLVLPVFLLLAYAVLRFCGTVFTELRDLVFAPVTRRTVTAVSERSFAHLMSLSPRFHVQRNTGSLIRDVERGTAGVGFLLGAGLFTVVPTLVEFVAVLCVLAYAYSLWFTLIVVLTFCAYATVTMLLTQRRELRQRRVNEMDSRASGRLVDSLLNYETVKTHAREDDERERYADICREWMRGSLSNQRALSVLHISQSAIIAVGVAAVMLLAAQHTMQGLMTVGDLVLVNAYILQICLPLNALGFVFREASDALVNTEKLFALLAQQPDIRDAPGTSALTVREGVVQFEHVDFCYEPGRQVLWDVSFTIGAGRTVAVVGGSGSGKSTLARLLLRLYDVEGGQVRVDGQDLRDVTLDSLRRAVGVVPQDTVLFNDTIAYNIAYGRQGAGLADVVEAAKAAQVHEFVQSLPQQYDTVVGERGMKLSGGEKQRIAIARAFLKNPPIMVFDEATSALDTRAERAIQGELDRIAQGRSTLVIAHRLSTIVDADEIIVLDKGRIVERGRHEELLARHGLYTQLWNLQRQQQQFERLERRLARRPVNLIALVANAIEALRDTIAARQVRVSTEIEIDDASITGDPHTLGEALRELCLWALQATPPGGHIALHLARREGQARLSVTDGRQHTTGLPGASGALPLGTATPTDPMQLRSTIERQGGRLSIEPAGALVGMRCVVELPLRAISLPGPPETTEPAAPQPKRPLDGLMVLVVDDHADARDTLGMALSLEGADVLPFGSGRDAMAWLQSLPADQWPQAMLCDIMLGATEEDGHRVMQRVRALEDERGLPQERRMPAIALTGLSHDEARAQALAAGFQQRLVKPVDMQTLVDALGSLTGRIDLQAPRPGPAPPQEMRP